jgi:hypothetical protein
MRGCSSLLRHTCSHVAGQLESSHVLSVRRRRWWQWHYTRSGGSTRGGGRLLRTVTSLSCCAPRWQSAAPPRVCVPTTAHRGRCGWQQTRHAAQLRRSSMSLPSCRWRTATSLRRVRLGEHSSPAAIPAARQLQGSVSGTPAFVDGCTLRCRAPSDALDSLRLSNSPSVRLEVTRGVRICTQRRPVS